MDWLLVPAGAASRREPIQFAECLAKPGLPRMPFHNHSRSDLLEEARGLLCHQTGGTP
jgi:hypothetical protein